MLSVKTFTFNPLQENTYVMWDESLSCAIVDPGCYSHSEKEKLRAFIEEKGLNVVALLCTHGHIDHILGNAFVAETYKCKVYAHKVALKEMEASVTYGGMYGTPIASFPMPDVWVEEGDSIQVGNARYEVIFTPGHSAGHVSFFHKESQQLFSGDVLFNGSVGRWDLPGGDYQTLMETIVKKVVPLGDAVVVYPGHGPATQIGRERTRNPFLAEYAGK